MPAVARRVTATEPHGGLGARSSLTAISTTTDRPAVLTAQSATRASFLAAARAAASAAARNAATMTGCEVRGTEPWVVVEVEVSARLVGSIPGAPERVTRRATAGTFG